MREPLAAASRYFQFHDEAPLIQSLAPAATDQWRYVAELLAVITRRPLRQQDKFKKCCLKKRMIGGVALTRGTEIVCHRLCPCLGRPAAPSCCTCL